MVRNFLYLLILSVFLVGCGMLSLLRQTSVSVGAEVPLNEKGEFGIEARYRPFTNEKKEREDKNFFGKEIKEENGR